MFFQPFIIVGLMVYRDEIAIPNLYGIREQDMEYYLWFAVIILFFQLVADMFILSMQEFFHGWKLYDYLVYTRYRFLQRETRWKGLEESLDECIEEGMRTLDQLCFSSQFYFMCTLHTTGVVLIMLGLNSMIRFGYNMFGDPAGLVLVPLLWLICKVTEKLCVWVADLLGIWRIKHASTAWHSSLGDDEDDEFGIPRWDELEQIKGASHEAFLMNQKLTSETFRHKFLDYNRPWLVAQLPSILTPRTLRRSRPYLIAQFTKLLGSVNPDISSDEDEDDEEQFGPVALSAASRKVVRWWLSRARRLLRLREVVQPIINKARKAECEQCLSRRQLQVELLIQLEELGDRFEQEHPNMEEFDQVAWKTFFQKHAKFRTICLNCVAANKEKAVGAAQTGADISDSDEEGPKFGPVYLKPASKALLKFWLARARQSLGVIAPRARLDVSSDDEDDDEAVVADWARRPVKLAPTSIAIARKWLALARQSALSGKSAMVPAARGRIKPDAAPPGKRSRFRRK